MGSADSLDPVELQNARLGYEVASNLWIYEGSLIWSKFNALLLANSVIVTTSGILLSSADVPCLASPIVSVAGLFISSVWLLLTIRGFDTYTFWIMTAKELEEKYLSPVKTVQQGGQLSSGEPTTFASQLAGAPPTDHKMSRLALLGSARKLSYLVISTFAALHAGMAAIALAS